MYLSNYFEPFESIDIHQESGICGTYPWLIFIQSIYQGLYKKDIRFGPGILTYTDGTQDIGLWQGDKIIKLLTTIDEHFSMALHNELDYDPDDHVKYVTLHDRCENK